MNPKKRLAIGLVSIFVLSVFTLIFVFDVSINRDARAHELAGNPQIDASWVTSLNQTVTTLLLTPMTPKPATPTF